MPSNASRITRRRKPFWCSVLGARSLSTRSWRSGINRGALPLVAVDVSARTNKDAQRVTRVVDWLDVGAYPTPIASSAPMVRTSNAPNMAAGAISFRAMKYPGLWMTV
jgi:hypothetical protein